MTAATTAETLTPADILARAEKRIVPMYFRHGITDYLIAVFDMYDALYAASVAGLRIPETEPTSDEDLEVFLSVVDERSAS